MKNVLYTVGIAQLLLHTLPLIAAEECCVNPCCEMIGGEQLDARCIAAGYPLPAIITPCGSCLDMYVKGDFCYWGVIENEQQIFAQKMTTDGATIKNYFEKGKYRPAFRVGAGIQINTWLLDLTYYRCHHHSHISVSAAPNELIQQVSTRLTGPPLMFSGVDFHVDIDMDYGLIALQQPIYLGKNITMNLGFGLMGMWIDRKKNFPSTAFTGVLPPTVVTADGFTRTHHKAWAIGPNLGFNVQALLPWGLKALGAFNVALNYASLYKGVTQTSYPTLIPLTPFIPALIQYNTTINSKKHVPHLEGYESGELGIGWGNYLWCDRYYLDISLTYMFLYRGSTVFGTPINGHAVDLTNLEAWGVHGLTVGGRFDF